MPTLLADTRLLGLYAGVVTTPNYLFLQTGVQGQIDAFITAATGTRPLFTLNGKVLRSSGGAPPDSLAGSGDFYIDSTNWRVYGPKTSESGTWGAGVSMLGPSGATGAVGPTGATGVLHTGLISGFTNEILTKRSNTDYDFGYKNIYDVLRGTNSRIGRPSNFTEVYRNLNIRGTSGGTSPTDMGSGCTYEPTSNTIYVVDNGTPSIAQFSVDGTFIRSITLTGFKDVEAIDWMYNNYFVIAEEYNAAGAAYLNKLHVIEIPQTGSITITNSPGAGYHIRQIDLGASLTNASPNLGIEGVAYDKDKDVFYVVTEKTANEGWKVWKVNNNSTVTITALFTLTAALAALSPAATDISDIFFKRDSNTLVMVSEEGTGWILEFTLDGTLIDSQAAPSIFYLIEGICFTPNGEFMFLTGEANTIGGDKPDFAIYQYNKGSNPSTIKSSHSLAYFQNGSATYLRGKIFDIVDPYSTATNNTYLSYTTDWPIGNQYMRSEMMTRGRKLTFNAFGDFNYDGGLAGELTSLYFNALDTGDVQLCPNLAMTGVNCSGLSSWVYEGSVVFSESKYNSFAKLELKSPNSDSPKIMVSNYSGNISALTSGYVDLAVKYNITGSAIGRLNVQNTSISID